MTLNSQKRPWRTKSIDEVINWAIARGRNRKKLGEDLYNFILRDPRAPDIIIDGVSKFVDFKRYLGVAVEKGIAASCKCAEEHWRKPRKNIKTVESYETTKCYV